MQHLFMLPNIFSAARQAAQIIRDQRISAQKAAQIARFGGIPARRRNLRQIDVRENYILHTDCIHRVATRGIHVYNFS
jgi:hypothetical protein